MDYRVDETPTLKALKCAVETLSSLPDSAVANRMNGDGGPRTSFMLPSQAEQLLSCIDGSLALRLLMERIGMRLDAPHHLVAPTYLAKREGNHGDWLARLDSTRPCKTIVSHIAKDAYAYVHPHEPRAISAREAARVQTFPDWFSFGDVSLTDALKMIGNAVPPLLSYQIAKRTAALLISEFWAKPAVTRQLDKRGRAKPSPKPKLAA